MNILHVYRTYFPDTQGGLEEAIRQLCTGTTALGMQNRIFTLSRDCRPPIITFPEATVHRFPLTCEIASCGFSLRCLSGFQELVDWADIIHYQFPWPFADMLHFLARVRKPAVVTYQSDIVRQQGWSRLYRPLMARFLRSMDAIVATSPQYARTSPVLSAFREKVQIIPIGLDPAAVPEAAPRDLEWVRGRFGQGYFLFIGMLRYYKGLDILLDAAERLPYPLVIAGDGPLAESLRRQAAAQGLQHVHFLGHVDQSMKSALLQGATAIVFPSHLRSEAFGVTLLEGAMFAKPLICAEIGTGTTYINRHLETGLVVAPNDPVALADAMHRLATDHDVAARLGRGARDRYLSLFTAVRMAQAYQALYRQLL